jgi:hypothetical protein
VQSQQVRVETPALAFYTLNATGLVIRSTVRHVSGRRWGNRPHLRGRPHAPLRSVHQPGHRANDGRGRTTLQTEPGSPWPHGYGEPIAPDESGTTRILAPLGGRQRPVSAKIPEKSDAVEIR